MADHQERIRRLRAKAASTTFPHEAQACHDKADLLEAKYGDHFAHVGEPSIDHFARDTMERVRRQRAEAAAQRQAEQERRAWMQEREARLSAMGFILRVQAGFNMTGTTATTDSHTWSGADNVVILIDDRVVQGWPA